MSLYSARSLCHPVLSCNFEKILPVRVSSFLFYCRAVVRQQVGKRVEAGGSRWKPADACQRARRAEQVGVATRKSHTHTTFTTSRKTLPTLIATNQPTLRPSNQHCDRATNTATNSATNQLCNQLCNQPTLQPTKQPTNSATNQPTNSATNQPTLQPTNQPTNTQPTNQHCNQPTLQPTTQQLTNKLCDQPTLQRFNTATLQHCNQHCNNTATNQQSNERRNFGAKRTKTRNQTKPNQTNTTKTERRKARKARKQEAPTDSLSNFKFQISFPA